MSEIKKVAVEIKTTCTVDSKTVEAGDVVLLDKEIAPYFGTILKASDPKTTEVEGEK